MEDHPIRRKDRAISEEECQAILKKGEFCVLATVNGECWPYAVPLSYVYLNGKLYFHCAPEGHKVSNMRANARCSAAVVGATQPVFAKNFTTYYESVILFGRIAELVEQSEKIQILRALAEKYLPEHMDKANDYISASLPRTAVYAITIERMTGKAKRAKPKEMS